MAQNWIHYIKNLARSCLHPMRGSLPVVEAMLNQIPVIASDIPVFKEVTGNYPTYFKTGDKKDLAKVLLKTKKTNIKSHDKSAWLTWDESIKIYSEKILSLYEKIIKQ